MDIIRTKPKTLRLVAERPAADIIKPGIADRIRGQGGRGALPKGRQQGHIAKGREAMSGKGQKAKFGSMSASGRNNGIATGISRYSLYVLIFLLPLFFIPGLGLLQAKQFLAIILIGISLIAWLIKTIKTGRMVYSRSFLNLAVLFFILVLTVSSYLSLAREKSLGVFGLETDTLVNFVLFGLCFFLAGTLLTLQKPELPGESLRDNKQRSGNVGIGTRRNIFWLILLIIFVLALSQAMNLFGIWINVFGSQRMLAIFLAAGLVMASCLLCRFKELKIWPRIFLIVFALLIAVELILINLRAIWFGLAIAMFFLLAFQQLRGTVRDRERNFSSAELASAENPRTGLGASDHNRPQAPRPGSDSPRAKNLFPSSPFIGLPIIILMLSIFLILVRLSLPNLLGLPDEISPTHSASFEISKQVLFENDPKTFLLGSGPGTFAIDYGKYRSEIVNQTPFWGVRFSQASSFILTMLAFSGILGILAIGALIVCFVFLASKALLKTSNIYQSGLIFACLFLIAVWFFYPLNFVLGFFTFLGLGLLSSKKREISLLSSPQRTFICSLFLIMLIVLATAGVYLSVQKFIASAYFSKAVSSDNLDTAISKVVRAISLDSAQDRYWRASSQIFLLKTQEIMSQENRENTQAALQQNISNAIFSARQAVRISPEDSLNWAILGQVYEAILPVASGGEEFLVSSYSQASLLEPKNPGLYLALARANLLLLNKEGLSDEQKQAILRAALENLVKSINLKPDYQEALMLLQSLQQNE